LAGLILLISILINIVLGLAQLADWLEKRRRPTSTAITNADAQPPVVDMRGSTFHIDVSGRQETSVKPKFDSALVSNDHDVMATPHAGNPASGICPFRAPPRPEL
jgi:hypothetical protein